MNFALITGSCGLVGSQSSVFFAKKNFKILGIDNNSRKFFFGNDGDVTWVKNNLKKSIKYYNHLNIDIRNYPALENVFSRYRKNIKVIIRKGEGEDCNETSIINDNKIYWNFYRNCSRFS